MGVVLEAKGLIKDFNGFRAVDGVDVLVHEGERVGLLGPNGAGKTTTLLMLLGVLTPNDGRVKVLGHEFPHGRTEAMSQVGFVAGYLPLPDKLRVDEILRVFADLYGVSDAKSAVAEGLERFGIAHLARQRGTSLSSGQRTLVGVVKAILHRPRLLILDEPTASLDPEVSKRVRDGLMSLSEDSSVSILITSHDMREVERLCQRVIFVSNGIVVADDTPARVAERFGRDDLEDVFLGLADERKVTR